VRSVAGRRMAPWTTPGSSATPAPTSKRASALDEARSRCGRRAAVRGMAGL
jgi:hypothetical protein